MKPHFKEVGIRLLILLGLIAFSVSATAILDRFLHQADVLTFSGKSYRLRNQASPSEAAASPDRKPAKAPAGTATGNKRRPAEPAPAAQLEKTDAQTCKE